MNIFTEIDRALLAQVAAEAISKAADAPRDARRWVNAIAKAVVEIENNPFMTWQPDSHSLLILSEKSGKIYEANGVCQCEAYLKGFPVIIAPPLVSSFAISNNSTNQQTKAFRLLRTSGEPLKISRKDKQKNGNFSQMAANSH